jgi:hypothetical protein
MNGVGYVEEDITVLTMMNLIFLDVLAPILVLMESAEIFFLNFYISWRYHLW